MQMEDFIKKEEEKQLFLLKIPVLWNRYCENMQTRT